METHNITAAILSTIGICTFFGTIALALIKSKFLTREEFKNEQVKCQLQLCKKIDELKTDQKSVTTFMISTSNTMGQIHQFMKNHVQQGGAN